MHCVVPRLAGVVATKTPQHDGSHRCVWKRRAVVARADGKERRDGCRVCGHQRGAVVV
jgi:hypothetical protein